MFKIEATTDETVFILTDKDGKNLCELHFSDVDNKRIIEELLNQQVLELNQPALPDFLTGKTI